MRALLRFRLRGLAPLQRGLPLALQQIGRPRLLIKLGNDVLPDDKKLPFDKFGFFVNKNGSVSEEWETRTGAGDVMEVAQVVR